jgi:cystathionine beta-lyase/cystathionine gamma-synthase
MEPSELSHILYQLGEDREHYLQAVSPPVFQSSNFAFRSVEEMRSKLADEMDYPFYTRGHNPTVAILRKKLAALEGTEEALVFSSGSAAVAAAVMSTVQQGDHIVSVQNPYSWTNKLFARYLKRFGVEVTWVEGKNPEDYQKAMRPTTRLLFMESPNSFTFALQDIAAIVAIAKAHNCTTILDNSYNSPLHQQPATMGVDIVVHSATKYLNGHSDIVAGVLCTDRKRAEHIFETEFMNIGGVISPHDAWLMIRGLRTLPIRMERVTQSAIYILEQLSNHPGIAKIAYPFPPYTDQPDLALRQMKSGAGQFSLVLKANHPDQIDQFCNRLQHFLIACSWGGYESLVFPVCGLCDSANYSTSPHPWNMVRFYIGLEDPDYLLQDILQALSAIE